MSNSGSEHSAVSHLVVHMVRDYTDIHKTMQPEVFQVHTRTADEGNDKACANSVCKLGAGYTPGFAEVSSADD